MNAIEMMELLRDFVSEGTAAHWTDVGLLRRLNMAQRKVAIQVATLPGQWLVTSADVTPVASVITLPADCSKPVYLEEKSSGVVVQWLHGGVSYRRVSRQAGTSLDTLGTREAYPLLSTLEVNRDSYTTACTLWYQIRVPDLAYGVAATGTGASALTFQVANYPSFVDDYYNNCVVEVWDDTDSKIDLRSTISDYDGGTATATITGTPEVADLYGTISRLPEETHPLIVLEATMLAFMKPSANLDKEVISYYRDERNRVRSDVFGWMETRMPEQVYVTVGDMY